MPVISCQKDVVFIDKTAADGARMLSYQVYCAGVGFPVSACYDKRAKITWECVGEIECGSGVH